MADRPRRNGFALAGSHGCACRSWRGIFRGRSFPHEDVYVYAVSADDGSVIWKQDNLSAEDAGRNDLSPQGYLLASDDLLFVPSGRSLPAAFDRKTGKLLHKRTHGWRAAAGGVVGGTNALLADGQIYSGGEHHLLAMEQQKGDVGFGWFAGHQMAVIDDSAYVATGTVVARLDREEYAVNSRVRHKLEMELYELSGKLRSEKNKEAADGYRQKIADANLELKRIADIGVTWQKETPDDAAILATPGVVFLGGQNTVAAYATLTGDIVWQAAVDGLVSGLAQQSELEIYVVEPDPEKFATARANLTRAGVYGSRVTVHQFDVSDIPYSNYFANLIVSDRFVKTGETLTDPTLVVRHLKPAGGVMCLGQPQKTDAVGAAGVIAKAGESKDLTAAESMQKSADGWASLSRGMLPGAGGWSHQYGNPANTAVSNDTRVKGDLGVLWYGDPGIGDMKLDLQPQFSDGGGYQNVNEDSTLVNGAETPWLYTSWAQGLKELTLPLLGKDDKPATFSVQLHFADARENTTDVSVFDVQFNDATVLADVTLTGRNGKAAAAIVREVKDVDVTDNLKITLMAKQGVPLLNAVKVLRNE